MEKKSSIYLLEGHYLHSIITFVISLYPSKALALIYKIDFENKYK